MPILTQFHVFCHMVIPYGNAIYGRAIWQCRTAEPYGKAIWQSHLAEPSGRAIWQSHMAAAAAAAAAAAIVCD